MTALGKGYSRVGVEDLCAFWVPCECDWWKSRVMVAGQQLPGGAGACVVFVCLFLIG